MTGHHRPSDLAAVAARSAVTGATTVRFDVTHLLPGVPQGTAPDGGARAGARIREALAFEAAGIGVRIRTWTPQHPEEAPQNVAVADGRPVAGPQAGDVTADPAGRGPPSGLEYAGHSVVNPSFLYDQTRATEILLTVTTGPWCPDLGDCRMVALAVQTLSEAAARDAGAPILLLQSPVAPYRDASPSFRKDGSGEEPRTARGAVIRMTVAVDETRPDRRLAMLTRIAGFAKATGMGMQVSDSRLGRVPGEWWTALQPKPGTYRREKGQRTGNLSGRFPSEVRVVTFVGPARVGSSAALFADLASRQVGVLALTATALQEIAFVHAVLPVAPARSGRASHPSPTVRTELSTGLGHLASECGLSTRRRVPDARGADLSSALDYWVLESGPVPLAAGADSGEPCAVRGPAEPERLDDARDVARPVWVSWNLPGDRAGPDPSAVVREQVEKVPAVASATVDYVRVRHLPDGRSRGRAKLSVLLTERFDVEAVPAVLSGVCSAAQTASVAQCNQLRHDVGDVDLRVVWRERWLAAR